MGFGLVGFELRASCLVCLGSGLRAASFLFGLLGLLARGWWPESPKLIRAFPEKGSGFSLIVLKKLHYISLFSGLTASIPNANCCGLSGFEQRAAYLVSYFSKATSSGLESPLPESPLPESPSPEAGILEALNLVNNTIPATAITT